MPAQCAHLLTKVKKGTTPIASYRFKKISLCRFDVFLSCLDYVLSILFKKLQTPPLLLLRLNSCNLGTGSLFLLAEHSQSPCFRI